MKTRIIQSHAESPRPPAAAEEPSSERPESRNVAARAVHRIANQRKAAIRVCLAFVTVAVLIGVLSIALARASATVAPRESASAAAQPAIGWTPCGPRLECANVGVPLNWRKRAGRKIVLAVTRHLASRPEERIGSLFVNPGGPGDSGVAAVTERGESLDGLTGGRFDIVGWDPRGSGASTPVSCFRDTAQRERFWNGRSVPTTSREERGYLAKSKGLARRCGALNGKLLSHISTADTVRDLDHLRRLVGDRKLTFLGESTGTFLGQTYANMFPRRVRAMALDGLEDPVSYTRGTAALLARSLKDVDRLFDAFLELCQRAGPSRCALAGEGSVKKRVARLLARLRRGSIPAPSASPPGELTYGEALSVIKFEGMPQPRGWPDLARQLDEAAGGDGSALETTANVGFASEDFHRRLEPGQALLCADSPARQRPRGWPRVVRRLEEVSRIGGSPTGWLIGAPCAAWPAQSADRYTGPWSARTKNPVLLIGTRLDPNTPLANAKIAQRRLRNAVLLTHNGYGHLSGADPSACVKAALGRYFVALDTPRRGAVCRSDQQPFDPLFGQPVP
jgi:pimeloyl-ACP methyl ester carboxylesterase